MSGRRSARGPGPRRSIAGRLVLVAAVLLTLPVAVGLHGRWSGPPARYDQVHAAQIRADWETDRDRRRSERAAMQAGLVHVAVVGDSYTEGSGMGGVEEQSNWTTAAAGILWRTERIPAVIDRYASGGSGYTVRGNRNIDFPELVAEAVADHPDYLVVFGSRNDMERDGVAERAAAAFAVAREKAPEVKLLVVGPPWTDENVPGQIVRVRDEVRSAALRAGADFVDPLQERWFFGADSKLIGTDQVHPTDAGHAYMGEKMAAELARRLADRSIADAVPLP